jgi:hypothetical protein
MLKSSRRPVVAGVRQSIRQRQCALRIEAEGGPLFLHSSHRHEPRSDSLCLIRSTPALPADSFTNPKIGPTKAKNNRVSQLPMAAPYTADVPQTRGAAGLLGRSFVVLGRRRFRPEVDIRPQHDCPLLAQL